VTFAVAVLASHNGSNLRALHEASTAVDSGFSVALVISNNGGSGALEYAREHDIGALHLSRKTHPDPLDLDETMGKALLEHSINLVVTAGWLKKIGPSTLEIFEGRIINVHPALLPAYGGQGMYGAAVHEAVLASGDQITGASVHHVTAEYDEGPVIGAQVVPVKAGDSVESLSSRVLEAEHQLLPAVVKRLAGDH
jgi:phosphoribosylglycinamide formyltransferase-1